MKRFLPILIALLALPAPALAGRDVLRERSAEEIEPDGLRSVRAENGHGDVRVSPSQDGRVRVVAVKVVRSGSREESRRLARELRVGITREAGQLLVRARYPSKRSIRIGFWDLFKDFEIPSSEVNLTLELPPGMPFSARTSSGDIETEDLAADQRLESTSGDVTVVGARGPLLVETTSGDVIADQVSRARIRTVTGDAELNAPRGAIDVHTTSGDLTIQNAADSLMVGTVSGDVAIDGAFGGLDLTTTSGEVKVKRARGRIEVGASSGSVALAVVPPLAAVAITTGTGDIDLQLDRSVGGRLELQTSNGTLQMDAPIQVLSHTRRRVTGQLRQSNTPIRLRSASGDIHVTTGEKGS